MGDKAKTKSTQEPKMTNGIERELGGIKVNLENINKKLDKLPCNTDDQKQNPMSRLTALETNQKDMKARMGTVEKIGAGIALVLGGIAAWFKATGGKIQ